MTRATTSGFRGRTRLARTARISAALAAVLAVSLPLIAFSSGEDTAGAAGVSTPGLYDAGSLTLTTGSVNNVVRRDAADAVVGAAQALTRASRTDCALSTNNSLIAFSTTKGVPGFSDDKIGDKTSTWGSSCGLVEAGGALKLALGSSVANLEISSFALDIEVQKNTKLVLTATLKGTTAATFELRSGNKIVPGQGSTTPGSTIFNCVPTGGVDHCRFSGDVIADALSLSASAGGFGLGGGYHTGKTLPSVLELTDIEGVLGCPSNPGEGTTATDGGEGTAQVVLARKENADPAQPCTPIPYSLTSSTNDGTPQVQFLKSPGQQASAAFTLDITWPTEAAQNPPPPSTFEFVAGHAINLELCVGTPVYDSSGVLLRIDGIGPANDQEPTLPGTQYSCYYHQDTKLVAGGTVELFQQLYVVGDYRIHR